MTNPVEKAEQYAASKNPEEKEAILSHFDQFQSYLGDKVNKGKKLGLGEDTLAKGSKKVAGFLAEHEEPRNREEYLLKELWKVSDEQEKEALSHILVKLAERAS